MVRPWPSGELSWSGQTTVTWWPLETARRPGPESLQRDPIVIADPGSARKGIVRAHACSSKGETRRLRFMAASICIRLNPYSQPIPAPDPVSATISLSSSASNSTALEGRSGGRDPGRRSAAILETLR